MLPPSLSYSRSSLAALALVTLARVATADPVTSTPSARLEVQEGEKCGTRAGVVARVHRRAPRVLLVEEPAPLSIRVRFALLASGQVEGVLVLQQEGAPAVTRRLVASSCREAVDGVALVIAVALGQPVTVDTPDAGDPTTPDGVTGSDNGAARETTPLSTTKPESPPPAIHSDERPNGNSPRAIDNSELLLRAHAGADMFAGPSPGVMPGVMIGIVAVLERASLLSPALALSGGHAWRTGIAATGGKATFLLDAATLDVCPIRLGDGPVEMRPCGAALLGRLSTEGSDTLHKPGAVVRPFAAIGASVLMTGDFGWVVEPFVRASLGANLVRDSFTFTPVVFHRVGPATLSGSAGVSLRLR
jgi:hypothetical protein